MANRNLIQGAEILGKSKMSGANLAFQTGLQNSMDAYYKIAAVRKAEKKAIDTKTAAYINTLNTDMDVSQLTASQANAVKNYLVTERNRYAQFANKAASLSPDHPEYSKAVSEINSIQSSFANLASELKTYKDDKLKYIEDFDNNMISDGNEIGALDEASNIYTDKGYLGIGSGGSLSFYNEDLGKFQAYSQIKKPFLKDFSGADAILQLNKNAYSAGAVLQGARKNMVRNDIKQIVNKGGRNTLLSLATDDFLIDGGLGIQDESLFDIQNEDLLKDYVINAYVDAITDTSVEGANAARPSSRRGSGGFSGALKDEINLGGDKAQEALDLSGSTLGDARSIVRAANSLDPTNKNVMYMSRQEFYNQFLEGENMKDNKDAQEAFRATYGDASIFRYNYSNPSFSRGLNIDINNQQELYKFYIQNSDFSRKAQDYYITRYPGQSSSSSEEASGEGSLDNL